MKRRALVLPVVFLALMASCSGTGSSGGFKAAGGSAGSAGAAGAGGGGGAGGSITLPGVDAGDSGTPCMYADSTDHDGDGWSFTQGDCNDCDPLINPGAYDIPKDGIDEDCNGIPDDEPTGCDSSLALESTAPGDGAKAIDLCRTTTMGATGKARTWGVISAAYVTPDSKTKTGTEFDLGFGLVPAFGVNNTQQGKTMLVLSSGAARQPGDPGYDTSRSLDKGYTSGAPTGYPKPAPACPGIHFGAPHDGVGLALTIRVPTNAKTLSFNENFFSIEFPEFVCSTYNDTYVVMMTPKTDPKLPDDNIAFDSMGNPISVNAAFLQVCVPEKAGGKTFTCTLGETPLTGTGFEVKTDGGPHAATGWLTTVAPVDTVKGQNITMLFTIWDSSDGNLDSSVLVDNFTWGFDPPTGGVTTVPTPAPK